MRKPDELKLRGAIALLSSAISHVGRGHPVDEWGDGRYLDPDIEAADCILRRALWNTEDAFRKANEGDKKPRRRI